MAGRISEWRGAYAGTHVVRVTKWARLGSTPKKGDGLKSRHNNQSNFYSVLITHNFLSYM